MMEASFTKNLGGALVLSLLATLIAQAQDSRSILPVIDVSASRLGAGIVGAATSVISAEEIERSPGATLQDLLAREVGIQTRSLFGAVRGAGSTVDLRGFGATAPSNTLVLINGRRMNEWDLAGFDLSTIPLNSIARIEITRGNSGAVLYGDGAVGGVINIVTKSPVGAAPSIRAAGIGGSFRYREGELSLTHGMGPLAFSFYGDAVGSDGYRVNNKLRQQAGVGDLRYASDLGEFFLNVSAENQHLGLPGARLVTLAINQLATDRRGTSTPFDYGDRQAVQATAGFTRTAGNVDFVLDGSVRRKWQQAGFFSSTGIPFNYLDTVLTTYAVTPRVYIRHSLLGRPASAIVGIDNYHSVYASDRSEQKTTPPVHRYDLSQTTLAVYAQETVELWPRTSLALGGRLQRNSVKATDTLDPTAPGWFGEPVGIPLDKRETQYAYHAGIEHWLSDRFGIFGRVARSFRVPNVDERIGMAPFFTPTTFDLRTQTSHDIEGGVRIRTGRMNVQASAYYMWLKDELHFNPITFTNVNLDPTRRYGAEVVASYQWLTNVRLKGGFAYTRAEFRAGPFAGNDVPLVSRWTANAGASWDIWHKQLVLDVIARYVGSRRMDNDQANFQPLIPAHTLVDVRLGGETKSMFWSFAIQNLFDVQYFDYAVASATTFGTYNAYPQPGRTYMARLGVKF